MENCIISTYSALVEGCYKLVAVNPTTEKNEHWSPLLMSKAGRTSETNGPWEVAQFMEGDRKWSSEEHKVPDMKSTGSLQRKPSPS